jgi:hypothetical protein
MLGVAIRGFHPVSIAIPMTTRPAPMTIDAYFALRSIAFVKSREIDPTTRNTAMNPDDVAAPTRSARAREAR